ncbi:hypothetical protein [Dolichospermum sp. UHCC 0684]|nr:hypothetical protein [Dolichospermum sp. UHCC 0684]
MAMTAEKALQNNQSILENFAFGEELDTQSAEIISGGHHHHCDRHHHRDRYHDRDRHDRDWNRDRDREYNYSIG